MRIRIATRKKYLAIIPARGGSKRLPGKNLRLFNGIPLIQLAINHAKGSAYLNSPDGLIIVSSDSEEILKAAHQPGITLHREPDYLAADHVPMEAVLAFNLFIFHPQSLPTFTALLQPTSPLRTPSDIDCCIEMLHRTDCVISTSHHGRNGAVYAFRSEAFLERLAFPPHIQYRMPEDRSLDINTLEDLERS